MFEVILLLVGMGGLWLGAELTTHSSLKIARAYKISPIFMGLTVLAFGTDLPELFIGISGALQRLGGVETSGIILGDFIGSALGQIGLILGIVGLFGVLVITKKRLFRDGLVVLGSVVLLFLLGMDGELSRFDGAILILVYLGYLMMLFKNEGVTEKIKRAPSVNKFQEIMVLLGGLAILLYAAHLTVTNAVILSEALGISPTIMGVFILGIGTSLPELALAISAVRKKASGMAVGNLIGSNIFDLTFAIGVGGVISGFAFAKDLLMIDLPILFLITLVVLLLFKSNFRIKRNEALLVLGMYLAYFILRNFVL